MYLELHGLNDDDTESQEVALKSHKKIKKDNTVIWSHFGHSWKLNSPSKQHYNKSITEDITERGVKIKFLYLFD